MGYPDDKAGMAATESWQRMAQAGRQVARAGHGVVYFVACRPTRLWARAIVEKPRPA